MAKYQSGNFLQLWRGGFQTEIYRELSNGAFKMFIFLKELEHRYTNGTSDKWFYQSDAALSFESDIPIRSLKRYKKELIERGLIKISKAHFTDEQGNKSKEAVTCYKILV